MRLRILAPVLALLATAASAGGTLEGRSVTLNVMTYDDPAAPLLESNGVTAKVGSGVEFGMGPEDGQNGFDVLPVQVQIGASRIELGYGAGSGTFWPASFNGYVLRFQADCVVFTAARIDRAATTLPLADSALRLTGDALYINVSGLDYGPKSRLAIDLDVADCALS